VLLAQSRALRAIERDLEQAGTISLQWYDVLLELNAVPDGLRMQDLAMRTVVSRTRVSRIVVELEQRGLVERAIDPSDGRASVATITTAGRQELRRAAPVYLAGIDIHFNRYLTIAQRNSVAAALQRVVDAHAEQIDPRR
jgi:DNA-binding MarR family transcriptional regulator